MRKDGLKWGGVLAAALAGCFLGSIVCSLAAEEAKKEPGRKIEAGKPQYLSKNADAWKEKGRIVGVARKGPEFKVTILTPDKREIKVVEAEKIKDGGRAYEVWLEPGKYIMVVSAPGCEPLDLKDLEVKKGNDLRIDLDFGKAGD